MSNGHEKIVLAANKTLRDYQNPLIDERIQQWRIGERKEMEDLLDVFITLKDSDGMTLLTSNEIKNQIAVRPIFSSIQIIKKKNKLIYKSNTHL